MTLSELLVILLVVSNVGGVESEELLKKRGLYRGSFKFEFVV